MEKMKNLLTESRIEDHELIGFDMKKLKDQGFCYVTGCPGVFEDGGEVYRRDVFFKTFFDTEEAEEAKEIFTSLYFYINQKRTKIKKVYTIELRRFSESGSVRG